MKKTLFLFTLLIGASQILCAQTPKPKLVVGIVIDQMRYDYLFRYEKKYGTGGFKRLLKQGYNVANCHYNYMPTYTGPGHASIYTGTTPATHGIIANDWYDKSAGKMVYCTSDASQQTVGSSGTVGQQSPHQLLSTTIGDELRVNTVKKAKVFGVALKDRASILPAGHGANGAFWFDEKTGKWVSSTFYYKNGEADLPQWVKNANEKSKELFLHHLEKPWNTLYDIKTYTESFSDNNNYEHLFPGETQPIFPHDLKAIVAASGHYGPIKATPFGCTITKDFAKLLIENEQMGKDDITDLLCISFSSPDYVGHQFGPSSVEMEDTYLRLDKDLEDLLQYLDLKVGKGQYTLFLTADHGAVEVPEYLKEFNIPGGYVDEPIIEKKLDSLLTVEYGGKMTDQKYVLSYSNQQVFLNEKLFEEKNIPLEKAKSILMTYLLKMPEVAQVYDSKHMIQNEYTRGNAMLIQNGFNHKRSGHLMINYQPGVIEYSHKGTTHGSPYSYDTHIPCLFFGSGIKPGKNTTYTEIIQIAPTVCDMLNIPFPNGCSARIIEMK